MNYLIPKKLNPLKALAICLLIIFTGIPLLADGGFSITIIVNYLDFSLEYLGGGEYTAWWISDIAPADTAVTEYSQLVKFNNLSNIPVDVFFEVTDHPDSTSPDTLWEPWTASTFNGVDNFVLRWASYSAPPVFPFFGDSRLMLSTPSPVDEAVPAGDFRYFCGWFIAPTDGPAGERHRLLGRFTITAS